MIAAMLIAVMMMAFCGVACADADPIRVSSLSEPQSVISEQDVSITIKIYNSSQTDMQEEITLFNPEGISVEKYSGLKGEQSVTYTGTWHVTKDQIDEGKIKYYIQYTVDTGNGPTKTTRTVPVTIQTEAAAPQLTATYSVSPVSAREGQTVNLSYTLSNTGNIELRNIVIENEGVSKEELVAPSLSVGEKVTLTDSFTMGTEELVSKPSITYQAADSKKNLTISDMARKTITVAEDGLEVSLSADKTEDVYPGERITLSLKLKNTGNTSYTGLAAKLSDGTALASGVELAPGASYDADVEWAPLEDCAITANVNGTDANGEAVGVISSEIAIKTQDASRALVLNILADVQTETIYSEPAVVRFGVLVENIGETDATTLTIEQAGTTVAKIPSLPSGESRTVVFDLETSIAGKFQFVVKGKDADGNEKSYESNILKVNYVAPTPAPTAVPTPTPVPPTPSPVPTATPAPTLGEMIAERVNLTVLYTVAGVAAALLAVILTVTGISGMKRKKRLAQAIDTIERSPDVRNHRGITRRRRAQAAGVKPEEKPDDPQGEPIVPVSELTEEEASRMQEDSAKKHEQPAAPAREENRRRRAVQEIPADETLRVAPVDERPEFIAQGRVDDSKTRIFGRLDMPEMPQTPAEPELPELPDLPDLPEAPEAPEAAAGDTIRLNRAQVEEIRQQAPKTKAKAKAKAKPRKAEKPAGKKKGFLFGGKKKTEEDDFFEVDEYYDDGDDDFIE